MADLAALPAMDAAPPPAPAKVALLQPLPTATEYKQAALAEPIQAPKQPVPAQQATPQTGQIYLQIAALDSETASRIEWQRLQARLPDLMSNRVPAIVQASVRDRTYWRLRTGFSNAADASAFCARLHEISADCWSAGRASPVL